MGKKARVLIVPTRSYYAVGQTDYLGPFDNEDEAYDEYLRTHRDTEPNQILLGIQKGKTIEGEVVWERDEDEDEDD
jgi:hypothetical protein